MLDFAHIHSKFITPLPQTVVEFAASLHKQFPHIIDTKYLLKSAPTLQSLMKNKSTSLSLAFTHMCGDIACTSKTLNVITNSSVKVVIPTELQRYTDGDSGAKHEAGYDAFMTGCIFAQACNHFDIDFTKIHSPTDLAMAVQLQKYVNLLYLGWINCVVLDLTTGGDATESRPMVRGRNRPKLVSNNLVLVWGFRAGYNYSDLRGLVSGVLGTTSSITGIFFLDESSAVIHFRNEQVATEFLHIMENTMAVSNDCLSSQKPLTTLLESGGTIAAASYDTYEQICKSSLSKLLFAEQAEAVGIRWKIKARLEATKRNIEVAKFGTKGFESNHQSGPIQEETLQDTMLADENGTLKNQGRQQSFLPYLSEDKFLDGVSAHNCAFAKRARTES
jgi:poly(A)-specific ribonuclease